MCRVSDLVGLLPLDPQVQEFCRFLSPFVPYHANPVISESSLFGEVDATHRL